MDEFAKLKADVDALAREVERVRDMWTRVQASLDRCCHDVVDRDVLELAATFRSLCSRLSLGGSIDRSWMALYHPQEQIDLHELDEKYRN